MNEAELKPATADQDGDFNPEQKRYLEGFVAGVADRQGGKERWRRRDCRRSCRCRRTDRAGRSRAQGAEPRSRERR